MEFGDSSMIYALDPMHYGWWEPKLYMGYTELHARFPGDLSSILLF